MTVSLFERLNITMRLDKPPEFHHVVMLHPKAIIKRPHAKAFDTSFLIKADQFPTWHQKFADSVSPGGLIKALFNMRSLDTVVEWGEKLMRQHRPADLLALPDFMRPQEVPVAVKTVVSKPLPVADAAPVSVAAVAPAPVKKLICAQCGSKLTYEEGKFCWNQAKRFNGLQYCREHQRLF